MSLSRTSRFAGLAYCLALVAPVVSACVIAPEMVRIPAGHFQMGSPAGEPGRGNDERLHEVAVGHFSMGKYAVTFAEYDCFIDDVDGPVPSDQGWGRGKRPVINVSWSNATAYAQWLSQKTGKHYRLPTEAEWEYAARAGTTTAYYWGNEIGVNHANCDGCGSLWDKRQTARVGSFAPNPWGLYDMLGNVWQWTCSAYDKDYNGGEREECASNNDAKSWRSLRGGSWFSGPLRLRAAYRLGGLPDYRASGMGFRLVQD